MAPSVQTPQKPLSRKALTELTTPVQNSFQTPTQQQWAAGRLRALLPLTILLAYNDAAEALETILGRSLTPAEVGEIIRETLATFDPEITQPRWISTLGKEELPEGWHNLSTNSWPVNASFDEYTKAIAKRRGVAESVAILHAIARFMEAARPSKDNRLSGEMLNSRNSAILESMTRKSIGTKKYMGLDGRLEMIAAALCSEDAQKGPQAAFKSAADAAKEALAPMCSQAFRPIVGDLADVFGNASSVAVQQLREMREEKLRILFQKVDRLEAAGIPASVNKDSAEFRDELVQMVIYGASTRDLKKVNRMLDKRLEQTYPPSATHRLKLAFVAVPMALVSLIVGGIFHTNGRHAQKSSQDTSQSQGDQGKPQPREKPSPVATSGTEKGGSSVPVKVPLPVGFQSPIKTSPIKTWGPPSFASPDPSAVVARVSASPSRSGRSMPTSSPTSGLTTPTPVPSAALSPAPTAGPSAVRSSTPAPSLSPTPSDSISSPALATASTTPQPPAPSKAISAPAL